MKEPTLTEVLTSLNLTHGPRAHEGWEGRVVRNAAGDVVFEGTAQACWDWLREEKLISC
jgi:hypothetical protein